MNHYENGLLGINGEWNIKGGRHMTLCGGSAVFKSVTISDDVDPV